LGLTEFTNENKEVFLAKFWLSDGVSKIEGTISETVLSQLVSTANNHSGLEIQSKKL
jgi:hypothetical protein